ncbi:MAG: hypothetical protein R3E83_11870 [Burkholderiaceae bacterium]
MRWVRGPVLSEKNVIRMRIIALHIGRGHDRQIENQKGIDLQAP